MKPGLVDNANTGGIARSKEPLGIPPKKRQPWGMFTKKS